MQLINPSIKTSILSGLLNPYDFVMTANDGTVGENAPRRREVWELPDTSILFLEAERLINIYDWYGSFVQALESQQRHVDVRGGKKPARGDNVTDAEEDGGEQDQEERRSMHVQARFMCTLYELDWLGFIKHTRRKADHVMQMYLIELVLLRTVARRVN